MWWSSLVEFFFWLRAGLYDLTAGAAVLALGSLIEPEPATYNVSLDLGHLYTMYASANPICDPARRESARLSIISHSGVGQHADVLRRRARRVAPRRAVADVPALF